MSELLENLKTLSTAKNKARAEGRLHREMARQESDRAKSIDREMDEIQKQAVIQLLETVDVHFEHAMFEMRSKAYGWYNASQAEQDWQDAAQEYSDALSKVVKAKIRVLEHFQDNPNTVDVRIQVRANVNRMDQTSGRKWRY